MNRKTARNIAAIVLILFGFLEIMGLMMLVIPEEYIPPSFSAQSTFWALISGIYGLSRIVAGFAIWSNRKWGIILGLLLCLTTMIVAPGIIPFGVADLILAVIVTVCLLYAWFGDEKILQG